MHNASTGFRNRSIDENKLDSMYKTDRFNIVLSRSESPDVQNYFCRRLEGEFL